jgi:hypothetical protein
MASFITPFRPIEEGPPWDWNPGATFLTAYNAAQENKRRNEEAALEMELAQILLPAKKAEAEFNMKKLAYDSQLLEKIYSTKSAALDASYRGITSAVGGGGNGGGSAGSASTSSSTTTTGGPQYQSKFGFGRGLAQPPQAPAKKPSWQVVTPAQPTPQGP